MEVALLDESRVEEVIGELSFLGGDESAGEEEEKSVVRSESVMSGADALISTDKQLDVLERSRRQT